MAEAHIPSIAVLASGNGSTVKELVEDIDKGFLKAEVGLVICNNKPGENVQVYKRMDDLNEKLGTDIKTIRISGATHPGGKERTGKGEMTDEEAEAIATILGVGKFTMVLLAGYMKKMHPLLVQEWGTLPEHGNNPFLAHALNTHPGMLPLTKGEWGSTPSQMVIDAGEPFNYHTVHTVSGGYDEGLIIAQNKVPVLPHYDAELLFLATQEIEKANLAQDVGWFLAQQVRWEAGETDIEFAMAA